MRIQNIVVRKETSQKNVDELEDANIFLLDIDKNDIKLLDVAPVVAYKYAGDFYALLLELDIPESSFQTVLQLNGLTTPATWKGDKNYIAYI